MYYFPNPAHKTAMTESGPPRWRPDKEPCPRMTPRERTRLLQESLARTLIHQLRNGLPFGAARLDWSSSRLE